MPMYTKSGRSLGPAVVAALIAVVVVLTVVLIVVTSGDDHQVAEVSPSPSASSSATANPSGAADSGDGGEDLGAAPTGCLADTGTDAQMVLDTQAAAPHTAYGAVEVAASIMRWTNQYPFPDADEIAAIESNLLSAEMSPEMSDLAAGFAYIASDPDFQERTPPGHPFGTEFTVSTRGGLWVIDRESTADRVTVHMSLGIVVDGTESQEFYGLGSPVLVWEDDAWKIVDTVPTDTGALEAGGTAFTSGC